MRSLYVIHFYHVLPFKGLRDIGALSQVVQQPEAAPVGNSLLGPTPLPPGFFAQPHQPCASVLEPELPTKFHLARLRGYPD